MDYKNYSVWRKSHQLTLDVYQLTEKFPKHELFNIVSQLRRASVSIPTNIAEGTGRGTQKEFKRFLQIALGSAFETEYLLILSKDLNYANLEKINHCLLSIEEVKKMLTGLIKKVKKDIK